MNLLDQSVHLFKLNLVCLVKFNVGLFAHIRKFMIEMILVVRERSSALYLEMAMEIPIYHVYVYQDNGQSSYIYPKPSMWTQ